MKNKKKELGILDDLNKLFGRIGEAYSKFKNTNDMNTLDKFIIFIVYFGFGILISILINIYYGV